MATITDAQRVELQNNAVFQSTARKAVENYAVYITGQDGTTGNLGGVTPVEWAKRRTIGKKILQNPNGEDYPKWIAQFIIYLKGQNVWTTDAATSIAGMVSSGKFEELANNAFALKAQQIDL